MFDLHGTDLSFVHGRIIGGIGGFLSGGPIGGITGFIGGGGGPKPRQSRTGPDVGCPGPVFCRDKNDNCVTCESIGTPLPFIGTGVRGPITSPREFAEGGFEAVMGRFGAGMAPRRRDIITLDCLPGMVLGADSICYNKRDITNKERKWPRGRRPLLTGGDRNAITRAARAARAIQRTEKQLRKLGMLKSPTRRPAPKQPLRIAPQAGVHVVNVE